MSRDYPRIGRTQDCRAKWTYTDRRGRIKSYPNRPRCAACGAEATHKVDVQVNWFRGDDEVMRSCVEHKDNAAALLRIGEFDPIDADEEVQMLMDRDMGDS